jgi:hypothetical protein
MKKIVFWFLFIMVLTGAFAQTNLTPDQIRRYANELGVPYEALQKLIDSHRTQTGQSQQPIIIQDMADFEFTSGYNVPGTLFQADFKWNSQNGRDVYVNGTGKEFSQYAFWGVPERYGFNAGDIVTIVFKVRNPPTKSLFELVSVKKK